ncbi:hypothetical protein EMPS_04402 [Entomortierella parvispora]|uniref:Uncharacterized protein n=1 Tax=Entomortierella parvispora TaxID=205924 RepID=A0A9P3H8H7_9FUNG|nr:hypothetical protein EMPS_04402 [Entomortierella parvispora]
MLLIKSLLVLCSAAVVFARNSGGAVASGAIFFGEDTTDSSANPYDIYANPKNHASAVSSVLVFSAKSVNFQPSAQYPKDLGSHYDDFVRKVSTFPGFTAEQLDDNTIPLDGSLDQFEKAIVDANPDYPHQKKVASNLRELFLKRVDDDEGNEWILSLVVIDKPEGNNLVKAGIISVILTIEFDNAGTAFIPAQNARLRTYFFRAQANVLITNAGRFSDVVPIVLVPETVKFFTSIKDETYEAATPCHRRPTVFMNQGQRALYDWYNRNY